VKTLKIGWAFENCPTLVVTQVMLFKVDHSSYKVLHLKKKKSNDVKTLRSDKRGEFIDELKIYA
jgi:hypothetical protein